MTSVLAIIDRDRDGRLVLRESPTLRPGELVTYLTTDEGIIVVGGGLGLDDDLVQIQRLLDGGADGK